MINREEKETEGKAADDTSKLAERDSEIARLVSEGKARDGQVAEAAEKLAERDAESAELKEKLAASQHELDLRVAQLEDANQALKAVRTSTSWKMTAPMRAVSFALQQMRLRRSRDPSLASKLPVGDQKLLAETPKLPVDRKLEILAYTSLQFNLFIEGNSRISFKKAQSPTVSIIIILYNQYILTFECLISLERALLKSALSSEVIILDNNSQDATDQLLERIDGANIIRSAENLHFLQGANRASMEASGEYLVFLNNDAQLQPATIEAALSTFANSRKVGAVGGRVILTDETLQEAGGIIWSDGTCLGYGRGDAISAPEYMFSRDVDYCSAVFMVTPRELFEKHSRFDERFAPAYYEDTDYCVCLQKSGYRIVYNPDCVILHHEFGSSPNQEQAFTMQRARQPIFVEKHREFLKNRLQPRTQNILFARCSDRSKLRILLIDDHIPHEYLGAGFPRAKLILETIDKLGWQVTLWPTAHVATQSWEEIRKTVPSTVEVMIGSGSTLAEHLKRREGYYHAVWVSRPHNMEQWLVALSAANLGIEPPYLVYDSEAIYFERDILKSKFIGPKLSRSEQRRLREKEFELIRHANCVLAVSEADRSNFQSSGSKKALVLGHALEAHLGDVDFDDRNDILFVGPIHEEDTPNADSLRWFSSEILPIVREELGSDIRLKFVGLNQAASISKLDGKSLDLVGRVDELATVFNTAKVFVAPTRFAAGVPLKIYEAASRGVPVVATTLLANQLGWEDGKNILAADDAQTFAEHVIRLFRDRLKWEKLRKNALERLREDCSHEVFQSTIQTILADICGEKSNQK